MQARACFKLILFLRQSWSRVRHYAISLFANTETSVLSCFCHFLVHCIRFDRKPLESPLFQLLVERAVQSEQFMQDLYWDLAMAASVHSDEAYLTYMRLHDLFFLRICSERGLLLRHHGDDLPTTFQAPSTQIASTGPATSRSWSALRPPASQRQGVIPITFSSSV